MSNINPDYDEYTNGIFSVVVSFVRRLEQEHPPKVARAIVAEHLEKITPLITDLLVQSEEKSEA